MDGSKPGKGAKAAVGGGHHAVAAHDLGIRQQPLRYQARVLNKVVDRVQHARGQDFVVRNFACFAGCVPHLPLMGVARVGPFKQHRGGLGLEHHVQNFLQPNITVVRAFVVAPAHMHADALRGHIAQRVVQRLHLQVGIAQKLGVVHVTKLDMAAHGQVGRVNLQVQPGCHNRLVFGGHGVSQRLQILLVAGVVFVGLEHGDHAGGGAVHEGAHKGSGLG